MDKTSIALNKFQAVVLNDGAGLNASGEYNAAQVLTLNAHLMSQGFVLAEDLFQALNTGSTDKIAELANTLMPTVQALKGSHVKHAPMYPNFPQQVMQASEAELYMNALVHYYSEGHWQPDYPELPREFAFESIKFQSIGRIDAATFRGLFTTLLASQDSLSEEDKAIIGWFLVQDDADTLQVPDEIPFHENKCLLAASWLHQGRDITPLVKTATDILRIVTYLSGGDVSLAENTRFKSLSRPLRRTLVKQLARVINEEDIGRHRNKWVRLFHNLHVGDYSAKVFAIAKKARNNDKLESFYGHLEAALSQADIDACIKLLQSRPGEFGRRLDHLLRVATQVDAAEKQGQGMRTLINFNRLKKSQRQQKKVIDAFLGVVDKIPTRNLLQLLGHLNSRAEARQERIVFPKGSLQKAIVIPGFEVQIEAQLLMSLQEGIRNSLISRFGEQETLGKVWLAPELIDCPLPTQQRSASAGLHNMARGTRLPLTIDKGTLRLFVYWKGMDIDLSATFHDEQGAMIDHVSYTNLKSAKYQAYHSGDITRAKQGASEFIDIDLLSAATQTRYLAMNVLVYSGPNFAEHETCYVGWMTRTKPNSNEVFDPATVEQKIDLTQACRSVMPVVFDLHQRQMVWADLPVSRNGFYHNNVESSQASIQQKLHAILNVSNKLSLYELFEMHATARGELADSPDDADSLFALDQGVTPFAVNTINAEYIV